MNHEELELLTDMRDVTALLYIILRCKSFEWLESSWVYDLQYGAFTQPFTISFLQTLFPVEEKEYLAYFHDSGMKKYVIFLVFFLFMNRARDDPFPPCTTLVIVSTVFMRYDSQTG